MHGFLGDCACANKLGSLISGYGGCGECILKVDAATRTSYNLEVAIGFSCIERCQYFKEKKKKKLRSPKFAVNME